MKIKTRRKGIQGKKKSGERRNERGKGKWMKRPVEDEGIRLI